MTEPWSWVSSVRKLSNFPPPLEDECTQTRLVQYFGFGLQKVLCTTVVHRSTNIPLCYTLKQPYHFLGSFCGYSKEQVRRSVTFMLQKAFGYQIWSTTLMYKCSPTTHRYPYLGTRTLVIKEVHYIRIWF